MQIVSKNSDVVLYRYPKIIDKRGFFQKTFNKDALNNLGFDLKEQYFSMSHKNVLRGFHFQTPPMECAKLIVCIKGEVLDVLVDLRKKSSTYLKCFEFQLCEKKTEILYIPVGFGHAFLGKTDENILLYNINQVYSSKNDNGILWNSTNFKWPIDQPKISNRDKGFEKLEDFKSPF